MAISPTRRKLRRALRRAGDGPVAAVLLGALAGVSRLPPNRALAAAHAIGVRVGPLTGRHRIVRDNLALAMPDLDEKERERIGTQMWGHQARLLVETAMLDRLCDWRPDASGGRVELHDPSDQLGTSRGVPTVAVTGHTGCFEMLPRVVGAAGIDMLTLFRPPNNGRLATMLLEQRTAKGARFVASHRGAARTMMAEIEAGGTVGVLADQKFRRGPKVPFLGVPAPTNELVARLALRAGSYVPARCVRLPDNRYRIDIEPRVPVAPDTPVRAILDDVNATIGRWVREHPEQWMWFHRRWG